jgi:hypothetical protein
MNEVRRVLRLASWRLWFLDVIRIFLVTATVALALVLLARIVEQVLGLKPRFDPWWRTTFIAAGSAAAGSAILWALLRRRRALSVAVELDERAGLRESLSTALCVHKSADPWASVMVETAQAKARTVNVSRAIPMQAPSFWPVPLATGLALLLVWIFMPNFDLLGSTAKQTAELKKRDEIVAVKADVDAKQRELKKMLDKAKVQFTDEKTDGSAEDKKPDINDPDAIRRSAVKQLTDLTQKIETAKTGEKQAQADAIKEAMKQLKQPGPGPLDEFSKALARGDFNKANEQLAEMSKQMAAGNMSPEQKDTAKAQMENMAKQLEKLSQNSDQLQKKLENSGLDKKAAADMVKKALANPEDVKKALEDMKNLTPEQKKQMLEMAKAASQCQSQCKNMGASMSKMAQGMSQSGLQQEGQEGMSELAKSLSEAEMMQEDMQNLDAALGEAKKQLAQLGECLGNCDKEGDCQGGRGQWNNRSSTKMGSGTGGGGRSRGGENHIGEARDFTTEKTKANVKTGQGPIIGQRLVYGEQVKGESVAEFTQGIQAGEQEAAEAIEEQQIPREYHDAVKHYFGRLADKVKTASGAAPSAPAAPSTPSDAKPADDAKPAADAKAGDKK